MDQAHISRSSPYQSLQNHGCHVVSEYKYIHIFIYIRISSKNVCIYMNSCCCKLACSAAPMDQAYISRTQPSRSLVSLSCSMCHVSRSQSGVICGAPSRRGEKIEQLGYTRRAEPLAALIPVPGCIDLGEWHWQHVRVLTFPLQHSVHHRYCTDGCQMPTDRFTATGTGTDNSGTSAASMQHETDLEQLVPAHQHGRRAGIRHVGQRAPVRGVHLAHDALDGGRRRLDVAEGEAEGARAGLSARRRWRLHPHVVRLDHEHPRRLQWNNRISVECVRSAGDDSLTMRIQPRCRRQLHPDVVRLDDEQPRRRRSKYESDFTALAARKML